MVALEIRRPEPLETLRAAVDAIAAEELDGLPDAVLEEHLVGIRRQIDRLETEFCGRLRRFERARGFVSSGAATVVSWLRGACRMSAPAAHERVQVARMLEAFPEVEESRQASEIGYQHVAVLARSLREVGPRAFGEMLDTLLEAARRLDASRLRYVTRSCGTASIPTGLALPRTRRTLAATSTSARRSTASSLSTASWIPRPGRRCAQRSTR